MAFRCSLHALVFGLGSVIALAPSVTAAAPHSTQASQALVDSRVWLLFEHRSKTGRTLPFFVASRPFEASGKAPLLVRFSSALSPADRARYVRLGAEIGRTLASGATKVRGTEALLKQMVAEGAVARASVDLRSVGTLPPLDLEQQEAGIAAGLAAYRKMTGTTLTGKGILVGDLDTSVDPFHPVFFAPLPPVAWLDADDDGSLTPDVDGIDLDQNGMLDAGEILHLLNGRAESAGGVNKDIYGTADLGLNPTWDYLFLDKNGDGARSVGTDVSGAENLPAMGEPVFVAEDLNGDGIVSVSERLLPLGMPKIRAIRHALVTYTRGINLSTYPPASSADNGRHATQVLSVVAGGQIGRSRFIGIAPEAELVLNTFTQDNEPHSDKVQWLADQGANIIITELGFFGTEPSDGSTELELLMDSLVDQGIVVVSAAGNLGLSTKHALAAIPASSASTSYVNTIVSKGGPSPTYVFFSVTWPDGSVDIGGNLTAPDGDIMDLDATVTDVPTVHGRLYSVAHGVTPKGAGYMLVMFTAGLGVPATDIQLSLKSKVDQPAAASLYIFDAVTGWTGGLQWSSGTADGCMVVPSFSAKTIAVSAYALHVGSPWNPLGDPAGAVRGYSGRGPDLWGNPGIDIASPDNPVTAHPDVYPVGSNHAEGTRVRWREFGGTSGAAPAVAGVAALLKEANPGLGGSELRQWILDAARTDAQVMQGTPAMWGAGKLDLGIARAPGIPPAALIVAPSSADPGALVDLSVNVTDDGNLAAVQARWDIGYDGTWDTPYASGLATSATMPAGGAPLDVKVEVIDADGWTAQASARIVATPMGTGGAGGSGAAAASSTAAAGSGGGAGSGGAGGSAGAGGSGGGTGGSAGAAGAGNAVGSGGSAAVGSGGAGAAGGMPGPSGSGGSAGAGGAGGAGGAAGAPHSDAQGCGCSVPGAAGLSDSEALLFALGGLVLAGRLRSRRREPRARGTAPWPPAGVPRMARFYGSCVANRCVCTLGA